MKVNKCESNTSTSTSTPINMTYPSSGDKGWICPRCDRVNAPWMRQCDCPSNSLTITCNNDNITTKDEWRKRRVMRDSDTYKIHPNDTAYDFMTVGGSDYYDSINHVYSNMPKNCSNCKKEN